MKKSLKSDCDMLDFAVDFADWAQNTYDVQFYALGDSEHCHLAFALSDILKRHTIKRKVEQV